MARSHFVKKAQKDYSEYEIKKGESYYWWKFNFGAKHFSKTAPRRSQLTQSSFLSSLYELQDRISSLTAASIDDLQSELDDIKSEIENLKDEQQDRLDSMPDHLRDTSSSGEMLQERIDNLESWSSDLDGIDLDYSEDDSLTDEGKEEALQEFIDNAINEIQSTDYQG